MLEMKNIGFQAGEKYILKDLNVTFESGKTYAITGSASSGKSLMMKILGGITKPTEGEVMLDGQNLYRSDSKRCLKNKIGFVFQDGVFISNLSIMDNLLLPVKYLCPEYTVDDINIRISELFDLFRIDTVILRKRPSEVAYSAKKVVNFIRAILIEPDIFLINMPLFNLDFGDMKRVLNYLVRLKTSSKTLIMTTNNKNLLETLPDEIIYLTKGTIGLMSKPKEFFSSQDSVITDYIVDNLG